MTEAADMIRMDVLWNVLLVALPFFVLLVFLLFELFRQKGWKAWLVLAAMLLCLRSFVFLLDSNKLHFPDPNAQQNAQTAVVNKLKAERCPALKGEVHHDR